MRDDDGWRAAGGLRWRMGAAIGVLAATMLAGCGEPGPPTDHFVRGEWTAPGDDARALTGAIAWRGDGGERWIIASDRPPPDVADYPYAAFDYDIVMGWMQAPRVLVTLGADGAAVHFAAFRDGGWSAYCEHSGGACESAVAYAGDDAIAAGYSYGDVVDLSVSLPLRAASAPVSIQSTGMNGVYDRLRSPSPDDTATMHAAYVAIRAALDRRDAAAFLAANGIEAAPAAAIAAMPGFDAVLGRFAASCPVSARHEAFGNEGTYASLLVYPGDADDVYEPVYFRRRGERWMLVDCGRG